MSQYRHFLLIPRIEIHNANALSSPYTIGFPAMTAWLGAVHAMQRQLRSQLSHHEYDSSLNFIRVGVVCHDINLHTYRGQGDFEYSVIGTANPLNKKGERTSFIPEARCALTVSLVIEVEQSSLTERETLAERVKQLINGKMKFAGGDTLRSGTPILKEIDEEDDQELSELLNQLTPGYALIERRDLMVEAMADGQDAIDALLDHLQIKHHFVKDAPALEPIAEPITQAEQAGNEASGKWVSERLKKGWIVPIATGFQGLTNPAIAQQQRDSDTLHCFAESVVTLGEFVMPYRIDYIDDLLWHYHFDKEQQLYLCQQHTH